MRLQELKYDSWDAFDAHVKQYSNEFARKVGQSGRNQSENLNKFQQKAELAEKDGDQESAYKFYFLCLESIAYIKAKTHDKKYMDSMYRKSFNIMIEKLEKLKEILRSRFADKEKAKLASELRNSQLKKKTNETLPKNAPVVSPISKKLIKSNQKSISCKDLKALMEQPLLPLLLVDVRPEEEFQKSRIIHGSLINIPPVILKQAKSANQIEAKLPEQARQIWSKRNEFKYIVLLDQYSESATMNPLSPLSHALSAINEWDPNTKYENEAVILDGGYEEWLNYYPTLSTDPKIRWSRNSNHFPALDDINYDNDLFDPPKPVPIIPKVMPVIPDRNKKPLLSNSKGDPQNSVSDEKKENKPLVNAEDDFVNQDDVVDEVQVTVNGIEEAVHSEMSNLRINGDAEPVKPDKNKNENVQPSFTIQHLKPEGPSETLSSSSGMKRSASSPNINQLKEGGAGAAPIPTIDRSSKPQPQKNVENYDIRDLRDSDPVRGFVTPGLTGLKNLRNTCYMNSILQCLSNTQELNKFFRNSKDFQKNGESKTEGAIAEEFRTVIYKLWAGEYKSFACKSLKNRIGHYRNTFSGYDQQDSHEFLTILIDWLHEDLKRPMPNIYLAGASEETGERAWGEFKKNNFSPIQELFYGQQRSVVTCTKCHERSITFEPFSNLSLPLPSSKDSCTLNDCLDLYVQKETILGWECPKCKSCRTAEKKLDITRLPPILVIHFKRFTSDGWCRKQQTYVDFPVKETLDLSNFLCGLEHRNIRFSLYAVSNHYGTMDSGHYTAYCKGEKFKRWYKFDDQEVSEISTDAVKTAAAYIVFYSRVNKDNT